MKRLMVLVAGLVLAVSALGCDDEIVAISIENPYDLRVQVWDVYVNGPYVNAFVEVPLTRDGDHTGPDGWTETLKTPANAQVVRVMVSWYGVDGYPHSKMENVGLQHQVVTKRTITIDARPLI